MPRSNSNHVNYMARPASWLSIHHSAAISTLSAMQDLPHDRRKVEKIVPFSKQWRCDGRDSVCWPQLQTFQPEGTRNSDFWGCNTYCP
uniref:Uncharacterized protein n=1 Tax=Rhizophora mucronata TaxID=61149 RepID=A0A2P2R4L0_RHIMU